MNDKELLELAARAAGFLNWTPYNTGLFVETGHSRGSTGYHWSPLTDDGDALRLAVQLKLNISLDCAGPINVSNVREGVSKAEDRGDDPCAATRLAIVRAAAAVGRGMGTKP